MFVDRKAESHQTTGDLVNSPELIIVFKNHWAIAQCLTPGCATDCVETSSSYAQLNRFATEFLI